MAYAQIERLGHFVCRIYLGAERMRDMLGADLLLRRHRADSSATPRLLDPLLLSRIYSMGHYRRLSSPRQVFSHGVLQLPVEEMDSGSAYMRSLSPWWRGELVV